MGNLEWTEVYLNTDGGEGNRGDTEWVARVGWKITKDALVPCEMTLANLNGRPVTPAQWRRVKPAEIIAASEAQIGIMALLGTWSTDESHHKPARRLLELVDGADAAGDERYLDVARIYSAAVGRGNKQPVKAVIRAFADRGHPVKESTVRGWIRTAKQKGYITETARPSRSQKHNRRGGDK